MYNDLSGPTKAVCYREVFTIRGVCEKRSHCVSLCMYVCTYVHTYVCMLYIHMYM